MIFWDIFQGELGLFPTDLCQIVTRCKDTGIEGGQVSLQKAENKKAENEVAEKTKSTERFELCP